MAVSFGICALLLVFGFRNVEAGIEDQAWDVVVTGDSIIGKERGEESVEAYFTEYSGMTMLNGAFGGNSASVGEEAFRYSFHEESLTLYELSKALCYRDFGVQWADMATSQTKIWYFEEALEALSSADLTRTDYLMLSFGTNDYVNGKLLDDPADSYNRASFGGALRSSIELIRETYPDLEIVLVTPPYCHLSGRESGFEEDFGGGTLDEYVELEKAIGEEYGVHVIDVFRELGIDETNYQEYMEGGLHLTGAGRELYGRFLAEQMKQIAKERDG